MAERIEAFTVTVPAGTAIASPQTTSLDFAAGQIESVEVFIPRGHMGLTGFQIQAANQKIIPYAGSDFIISDDDTLRWNLEGYPNSGDYSLRAYNTDVYDHAFYVRFLLRELRFVANTLPIIQPIEF